VSAVALNVSVSPTIQIRSPAPAGDEKAVLRVSVVVM
jgi:hypothetical protein